METEEDDAAGVGLVPVDIPGDGWGGQGLGGGAVDCDVLLEGVGSLESSEERTPGQSRDRDQNCLHGSVEVRSLRADLAPVATPGLTADLVQQHTVGVGTSRGDSQSGDGKHLTRSQSQPR